MVTKNPPSRMDESRVQIFDRVFFNKVMRGLYMSAVHTIRDNYFKQMTGNLKKSIKCFQLLAFLLGLSYNERVGEMNKSKIGTDPF
jgi:ascorbate-specific PTS system EIIC-type component UlaA